MMFFKPKEHRVVIIGDRKVGKTSLLHAKLHNFYFESIPAVYAQLNTNEPITISVEGKDLKLINWELVSWDSDPLTYLRYRPMIYGEGDVWIQDILEFGPSVPRIVVGMKADARSDTLDKIVGYEEGKEMAKIVGGFAYVECSSKTRQGVDQVFIEAARAIKTERIRWLKDANGALWSSSYVINSYSAQPQVVRQINFSMLFSPPRYKVVVIGDRKVGKTSLLYAKLKGCFFETALPVYAQLDTYQTVDLNVDGKDVELINWELVFWDTEDDFLYNRLRPLVYCDGNVVLVCFDIGDKDTLLSITEKWVQEILALAPDMPVVVVGLKSDTRDNKLSVTNEEGKEMARIIGAFAYVECSAKTKDGIDEVFVQATRAVWSRPQKSKSKKCIII
ncbi:hypothetical protein HDV06_002352 [Boothiomyces sp. JEL0866]|nr:hypothetical protein HDV06_002352 [Boothiomyces sp. JEL0866]